MAHLLSQQDDFKNQPSMLETFIHSQVHEWIFFPKFHYELNPIEMICTTCSTCVIPGAEKSVSTGVGASTIIAKWRRKPLRTPRKQLNASLENAWKRLYSVHINCGGLWVLTIRFDGHCWCMGCVQAKAAPGDQSDHHDGHWHLDEPPSPSCWGCWSLSPETVDTYYGQVFTNFLLRWSKFLFWF